MGRLPTTQEDARWTPYGDDGEPTRPDAHADIVGASPPVDILAESCALGSALIDDAAFDDVSAVVGEFDFADEKHQIIFRAMKAVRESGKQIDVTTIQSQLKATGKLGEADDQVMLGDLARLAADVPHSASARHYAESVRDSSDKRRLHRYGIEVARQALNGTPAGKLLEFARNRIDAFATRPGELDFGIMTTAELDAGDYDVEFYIEDVLVARQPMILAGAKKSLKTSILIAMAVALALGDLFLRKFVVNGARRVLIFSGESGAGTIRETCRRVVKSHGYTMAELGNLYWSVRLPRFGDAEHIDALRVLLKRHSIEVVIVDPAYLALPSDEPGNLFAQGALLSGVTAACEEAGATLILAHHTKKNVVNPFQPVELEDISWAGFQEWTRQWALVSRRTPYNPGTGEHRLWLTFGGSVGHSSLWGLDVNEGVYSRHTPRFWEPTIRTVNDARETAKRCEEKSKAEAKENKEADARAAVRKALAKQPDGCTKTDLKAMAQLNTDRLTLALTQLLDAGHVEVCELKKSKGKFPGYRLTNRELEVEAKLAAVDGAYESAESTPVASQNPDEFNDELGF
ncbi:MAG: hypothetical protein DCC68_25300 [Planctomycetota bacterium]|nr:MAG: hypothetical protein DCC68_25300 [Planctomycetota bacterium]